MVAIEEFPTAETEQKSPAAEMSTAAAAGYNSDAYETASETELNDGDEEQSGDRSRSDAGSYDDGIGEAEKEVLSQSHEEDQIDEKEALECADSEKLEGNSLFRDGLYEEALIKYELAMQMVPDGDSSIEIRSICHANRAACFFKLGKFKETIKECTKALELNPMYIKVFLRRAEAHEKLEQYEEAITDMTKILELDPSQAEARKAVSRLKPLAEEKREKIKEEMIEKLKEMGNSLLGHFGMSVDNFKAVKDPNTGSYSINFQN